MNVQVILMLQDNPVLEKTRADICKTREVQFTGGVDEWVGGTRPTHPLFFLSAFWASLIGLEGREADSEKFPEKFSDLFLQLLI